MRSGDIVPNGSKGSKELIPPPSSKKPGEANYNTPKVLAHCAALDIGQSIRIGDGEKDHIRSKKHGLCRTPMGPCRGKSTDSALEPLTEHIHTSWRQGKNGISIEDV